MRIAYIYDVIYPYIKGGAEKRIWEISKRLVKKGHEVHLFGIKWWNGENVIMKDGVYLHGVCDPKELYVGGRRSIKEAIYFAYKVLFPLLKENFDIVDCQQSPYFPCFSAKIHSLLKRTPLVITWYEVWGDYWFGYLGKKGVFGWIVERMAVKLPSTIIPISEKIKEDLKSIGVSEKIMSVVPNGVDFQKIEKVKPDSEEFDVIYVGRLISHKNVDVLLKALSKLKQEIPDIKCGIIGDGPEKENLIKLSKNLGLDNNVTFFGFVEREEDVYSYMKSSKIFVLPSTREGFPNTILEANSCGLPAVIVKHEKNASVGVVKDGYNGFILDLSPEGVAKKVTYLLQNEEEMRRLSENARDFARGHDWSVIVKRIEEVYERVLRC